MLHLFLCFLVLASSGKPLTVLEEQTLREGGNSDDVCVLLGNNPIGRKMKKKSNCFSIVIKKYIYRPSLLRLQLLSAPRPLLNCSSSTDTAMGTLGIFSAAASEEFTFHTYIHLSEQGVSILRTKGSSVSCLI